MKIDTDQFDGVAFDFDGTLADTYATHSHARALAFEEHGLGHITPEQHALGHTYGNTTFTIIGGVLKAAGVIEPATDPLTDPLVQSLVTAKNKKFKELSAEGLDAQSGAVECFREFASMYGARLAIVTTALEHEVRPFLYRYNLGDLVNENLLIGQETIEHLKLAPKPAPDAYILAAKRMGIKQARMLVIEDSPGGVQAGKLAGAQTLAVGTTNDRDVFYGVAPELQPDYFAEGFSKVEITKKAA